jgi:hypothetical protein
METCHRLLVCSFFAAVMMSCAGKGEVVAG